MGISPGVDHLLLVDISRCRPSLGGVITRCGQSLGMSQVCISPGGDISRWESLWMEINQIWISTCKISAGGYHLLVGISTAGGNILEYLQLLRISPGGDLSG